MPLLKYGPTGPEDRMSDVRLNGRLELDMLEQLYRSERLFPNSITPVRINLDIIGLWYVRWRFNSDVIVSWKNVPLHPLHYLRERCPVCTIRLMNSLSLVVFSLVLERITTSVRRARMRES